MSNLALIVFGCLSIFILNSCSKENKAPQPPHLKAQLVYELFSALRQKNYEIALDRIDRLREIDPNDVPLQSLQSNVQNNFVMQKAQELLDKGDVDGAINSINDFATVNGQTNELRDALAELNVLKDIKTLINNAAKDTNNINLTTHSPKNLSRDDLIGLEDLKADIDISWIKDNKDVDTLIAILETENPLDSLVSYYKESMSGEWQNLDIVSYYLNTNAEFLVFRILADSSFELKNKQLIKKIASYEANNYRDMLAKAIILNFMNDADKSNTILETMKEQLDLSDEIYKSWFAFTPKNNSLDNLNPLATIPFFIYCNRNAYINPINNNK